MTPRTAELLDVGKAQGPRGTRRLFVAGAHAGLAEHQRILGPLRLHEASPSLIEMLESAGLTGRGGVAFESWRKVAATAQGRPTTVRARRPVVIANGAEGEPLSFKDKMLLVHAPHLVFDGLLASGHAVA